MRISHARSRYIYDLYYKREAISKPLYDWLLKEGYADAKYVFFTRGFSFCTFRVDLVGCGGERAGM